MSKKIIAVNAGPRKGWFTDTLIEKAMDHHQVVENPDVDQILAAEAQTYEYLEGLY